jgi:hypothetical protein
MICVYCKREILLAVVAVDDATGDRENRRARTIVIVTIPARGLCKILSAPGDQVNFAVSVIAEFMMITAEALVPV